MIDRNAVPRRVVRALVVVAALGVVAGCGRAPEPVGERDVERAKAALAPLKQGLMGALQQALPDGLDHAIEVCQGKAPEVAAAAEAVRPGVRLGRTSHRLRNPDNAPRPWVAPLLEEYVADPARTEGAAVRLPGGGIGWVEPIRVQAMCLACHGETVAEPVRDKLAALYPEDAATGFAEGDFRGLFWVELPPADPGA